MVASFWIFVQKFYSDKMMTSVKFHIAFPDDEVCSGLGDFICFCFLSNWIPLFSLYISGYTLANLHLVSLPFLG